MENMTDLQILDLIRNDLINVRNGMENFQNDMKKVQNDMEKLQESLGKALACTKKLGSLVEDGLCDVEACVGDSTYEDPQQQIFIADEDDDHVDEAEDTINLGDELLFSVNDQVVVPYQDEISDDDINAAAKPFKAGLSSTVGTEVHDIGEHLHEVRDWSYFPIFDPGIYAKEDGRHTASTCIIHKEIEGLMIIHEDDSCVLLDDTDIYALAKKVCCYNYKHIKHTEGVSSIDITRYMFPCVRGRSISESGNGTRVSPFLPISRRIAGAFDFFHASHVEMLEVACGLGDFHLVGLIGSPWEVFRDMIKKFNVSLVVQETVAECDEFLIALRHPLSLVATGSSRLEEFDPFWIATLDSTFEARQRLMLMNLICTCSNELFLHSMTQRHLKIVLKGGHVFLGKAMVRDYDGFNGPGFFRGAFDSILALVRDYDGFNGPGHTLRTRCL